MWNIKQLLPSHGAFLHIKPCEKISNYSILTQTHICTMNSWEDILEPRYLFFHFSIFLQAKFFNYKMIGENMFCMKAHQLSIVLPSKSRLVQLRIYTSYTKTCFFLGVACYFSRMTYFWSFGSKGRIYFRFKYDKTDNSYQP
jgi:hypothetical protein